MYRWNRIAQLSALGACCSLAVWISSTNAKNEETSVLVKKPAATTTQGPVLPPPAKPANPTKDLFAPQQPAAPTATQPKPLQTARDSTADEFNREAPLHATRAASRTGPRSVERSNRTDAMPS